MNVSSFWIAALFLLSTERAAVLHPLDKDVVGITVGDKALKGKRLKPFEAVWHMEAGGPDSKIREVGKLERIDGKACYVRKQVIVIQPGIEQHSELVLDGRSLQTIRYEQKVVGLPVGASLGPGIPVFSRWDFDGAKYKRTREVDGAKVVDEDAFAQPMFEGSALGLVIAALPLKEKYSARLPVAMSLNLSPEFTFYDVQLRVVGKESFARERGKDVEAWIVEVDWLDPKTGEVTSKGGAEEPGGAYFVVPKPPKGFPHVPRYANNGGRIEYLPEE